MKQQILDGSIVPGRTSVFCVGSFARKVNFAAQQNRALNLVWALAKDGRLQPDDRVAIIGAGLTGLTAAAGLIAHNCFVDLYEAGLGSIARQTGTQHRYVHPTINRWPHTPTGVTTSLPFLEWHVGPCDLVTKSLNRQFQELKNAESRLIVGHQVTDIVEVASDMVRVVTEPPETGKDSFYKIVIIAVGYGIEKTKRGFEFYEYWEADRLESVRDTRKVKQFVVSGCGDGGLIDALRVVHLHFERGMLAFQTAAGLDGTEVAQLIAAGETAALSKRPTDLADGTMLQAIYKAAVDLLIADAKYKDILDRLDASLNDFKNVVYLGDEVHRAPFSITAAPIHKLMLEHALRRGRIKFEHGVVEKSGKDFTLAGVRFTAVSAPRVVIRHGAEKVFGRLLSDQEVKQLAEKQGILADYHADQHWDDLFPVPPNLPRHDPKSMEFIINRKPLAKSALMALGHNATLAVSEDGFCLTYDGDIPAMAPSSLYGIHTAVESAPQMSGGT